MDRDTALALYNDLEEPTWEYTEEESREAAIQNGIPFDPTETPERFPLLSVRLDASINRYGERTYRIRCRPSAEYLSRELGWSEHNVPLAKASQIAFNYGVYIDIQNDGYEFH